MTASPRTAGGRGWTGATPCFGPCRGPLTWLAADTALGAASTLQVRVDGVRWHEVDGFAGRGLTTRPLGRAVSYTLTIRGRRLNSHRRRAVAARFP